MNDIDKLKEEIEVLKREIRELRAKEVHHHHYGPVVISPPIPVYPEIPYPIHPLVPTWNTRGSTYPLTN